ncbi:MAG: 16S rRNA (adenine(1518)-N(6)/adenine(1519)-N(6))-dimethyltransferase RsmA [Chlorobi bacterium]|nr:16S rRNA (adenine(1518)-N(6)/adenine(1519)-N(6))-dimethyltransferase RsmA [Chlorobiota bacterium]
MVRPKKHLGQHFLADKNIALKIAESLMGNYGQICEVGPGTGVLTRPILDLPLVDKLKLIEIDPESVRFLNENFQDDRLEIIEADFLKIDISTIFDEPFALIGNFPYNISSQIFFKVLDNRGLIPEVVCMIQKEVAERLASPPGNKTYGILSVLLQAWYDIEYLFSVSENVFVPPPKVKSAVIRLRRNKLSHLDCDEKLFRKVVKAAFHHRRKTIKNNMKFICDEPLPEHGLLSKRAEQLSVDDFVLLV